MGLKIEKIRIKLYKLISNVKSFLLHHFLSLHSTLYQFYRVYEAQKN